MSERIWTSGHSTRTLDEFLACLKAHGIRRAVDVRMFPGSRRYPHFSRDNLTRALPEAGVGYDWLGLELGGRRRRLETPSRNTGLRNESFRNFADYMETDEFSIGIDRLLTFAKAGPTAYFCAELLWWRCHRRLISDYLVEVRGWEVRHILGVEKAEPHKVTPEARRAGAALVYAEPSLFAP